jgi:hypothetical protein
MSEDFGEAYAFGSHRGVGLTYWAVAKDGDLTRQVSQADATTTIDHGAPLPAETKRKVLTYAAAARLGQQATAKGEQDTIGKRIATEETVLELAGEWSINPIKLDEHDEKGVG